MISSHKHISGRGSDALFVWCSRIFIILCHTALIAFPKLTLFRHFWHTAAITFAYLFNASLLRVGPFNWRGLKLDSGHWQIVVNFPDFNFMKTWFKCTLVYKVCELKVTTTLEWYIFFFWYDIGTIFGIFIWYDTMSIQHFGLFFFRDLLLDNRLLGEFLTTFF